MVLRVGRYPVAGDNCGGVIDDIMIFARVLIYTKIANLVQAHLLYYWSPPEMAELPL